MSLKVKDQYERHPYPPIPLMAMPKKEEAKKLSFERGYSFLDPQHKNSHVGKKILVVGAGTFESLVVALAHPKASEVVALDLSQNSLSKAKKRYWISKVLGNELPKVRFVCQDAFLFNEEDFDFILLNNVLQHVENPPQLLLHLSGLLKIDGLMRVVTYPKQSRMWMRYTQRYLAWHQIQIGSSQIIAESKRVIEKLPHGHPIRSNFESNSEIKHRESLIDAFFHVCENPLRPLEIQEVSLACGLKLIGEDQHEFSQSHFIKTLYPELSCLNSWDSLQVLDDALELCANPVLWFIKEDSCENNFDYKAIANPPKVHVPLDMIPSEPYVEMKQGLLRIQALISEHGLSLEEFYDRLKSEVGSRIMSHRGQTLPLPGLAITDYPLDLILEASDYYFDISVIDPQRSLIFSDGSGELIQDAALRQIEWAQLRFGHVKPYLEALEYVTS